jgi:Uncharacterised conserved protein (DUF2228)
MQDFTKSRELLRELYGFEFPDNLFYFHDFLNGIDPREAGETFEALSMSRTGLLQVLALPEGQLRALRPAYPMVLHWRFYRDLPEFFTCLHGDTDGLHWGLLLDRPEEGFKGAASYYNNDADTIQVYTSLFDALLAHLDWRLASIKEMIEYEPEEEPSYRRKEQLLIGLQERAVRYISENNIQLDEGRGNGIESDTGLDLLAPDGGTEPPSIFAGHVMKEPAEIKAVVRQALADCERGEPLAAFSLGRSLHYWAGRNYAPAAYELLRTAYVALGRSALVRVLDVHHQHRDLPSVDLLAR